MTLSPRPPVVVGVDGSEGSHAALEWAVDETSLVHAQPASALTAASRTVQAVVVVRPSPPDPPPSAPADQTRRPS